MRKLHHILKERQMKEAYIVHRVDDYANTPNQHGGFLPLVYMGGRNGCLWPTYERAVKAAQWVQAKSPDHKYGVFKMVAIVEAATLPSRVIKV